MSLDKIQKHICNMEFYNKMGPEYEFHALVLLVKEIANHILQTRTADPAPNYIPYPEFYATHEIEKMYPGVKANTLEKIARYDAESLQNGVKRLHRKAYIDPIKFFPYIVRCSKMDGEKKKYAKLAKVLIDNGYFREV